SATPTRRPRPTASPSPDRSGGTSVPSRVRFRPPERESAGPACHHFPMVPMKTDETRRTVVPLAAGAAAMLSALVGVSWLPGAIAAVGASVAGWVNPRDPVRAGLLTVALPAAGAFIRALVDRPSMLGAVLSGTIGLAVIALVLAHFGAGLALRRADRRRPPS